MKRILRALGNITSTLNTLRVVSQNKMPFYAVASGREVGVYSSWSDCERNVKGFPKPVFKKFKLREEAEQFLKTNKSNSDMNSFNPKGNAIPLGSNKRLVKVSECKREEKSTPKIEDSWPDDVAFDAGDNDLLARAVEEFEGIPENSRKRKLSLSTESDISSGVSKMSKRCMHDSRVWEPIGLKRIGKFEFPIDSEGYVIVYTDGSCINNGQAGAVAGFGVYFSEGHSLNTAQPVKGRVTNNAGEIQAAIHAIQIAKDFAISKLCLSTDSQFLINAATLWIKGWKRKGWRLTSGAPVKNVEDFKILDEILDGTIDIKWNYVKGHKGIEGNEKADQLARQGADIYRKNMMATKKK